MTRRLLGVCWTLLVVVGSATAQPAAAGRSRFGEGTHAFRRILFDRGFRPVAAPGDAVDPAETLVVLLGDTRSLAGMQGYGEWLDRMDAFVRKGGAVLVASDRPSWPGLKASFGISISGEVAIAAANDRLTQLYRGLVECPLVVGFSEAQPPLFAPPQVATNIPSRLDYEGQLPRGLRLLATLTVGDPKRHFFRDSYYPSRFAVGGEVGRGRVLIVADHSVFINDMMLQEDSANLDFAFRVADWLRGPAEAPRTRVIYFEEGTFRDDFDIPLKHLPPPPIPPADAFVAAADATLRGMEEKNELNTGLLDAVGEEVLSRWLAIAGCAAVGAWVVVRLGLFRHRADVGAPTVAKLLAKQGPALSLVERRARAQVRDDNLWEAARAQVRAVLPPSVAPPPVAARGGWWTRRRWRRRVERLWRLGYGPRPERVSRRRFTAVVGEAERLRKALADGTVSLPSR